MSQINVRNLSNENEDGAPDIVGVSTFSATSYFVPPKGTTLERPANPQEGDLRFNTDSGSLEYFKGDTLGWEQIEMTSPDLDGGARGVFGQGYITGSDSSNTLDYITISTTGNATDFGDTIAKAHYVGGCSSRTRGYMFGGQTPGGPNGTATIDTIVISSTGNATDYGDLNNSIKFGSACSTNVRGVINEGYIHPAGLNNTLEYIVLASSGSAKDFGDLTVPHYAMAACSSSTRGFWPTGQTSPASPYYSNAIDYVNIMSTGNSADWGDLDVAKSNQSAIFSNAVRGIVAGGLIQPAPHSNNDISYFSVATAGNGADFGDTSAVTHENLGGLCDKTRGVFGGGQTGPTAYNVLEYIQIATTGNAKDFGDLTVARLGIVGMSNGHGGL